MAYLKQVGIAFDQLLNALFLGFADETLSARSYRMSDERFRWYLMMRFIDALFFWEEDHCYKSYTSEVERKHLPKEYRKR